MGGRENRPGGEVEPSDWQRPALDVARDLLGMQLCRLRENDWIERWAITEVEAYIGPEDKACHAAKGRTARTEVMFGPAGVWYVYLCYGVHWLANLVTGPPGHPEAVLLRGAGAVAGPGRLTKALGVTGKHNDLPAVRSSGFWIETGEVVPEADIVRGPRVGVDYAGPEWAPQPFRLIWKSEWAGKFSRERPSS